MRLKECLNRFRSDERGNFAMITALGAVPIIGIAGLAVDFTRATHASDFAQGHSDAIALAVASRSPETDSSDLLEAMATRANEQSSFGDVVFTGSWISASDYRVVAEVAMPLTLSAILPSSGSHFDIATQAVARYQGAKYHYKPPTFAQVAPDASDYNRISAYCYGATSGRSQFVDIADNASNDYSSVEMPICAAGEVLSYRLTNVEWGKSSGTWRKTLRNDGKKNDADEFSNGYSGIYYYYTDTILSAGSERYDPVAANSLETILCDSASECRQRKNGGILPNTGERHRTHTRGRATEACSKGKFMYYGWEDRPPGTRGSDSDFDDIRVVIECPEVVVEQLDNVSLVR